MIDKWKDILVGAGSGLAIGLSVSVLLLEDTKSQKPIEVIKKDVNNDNIPDIVQKYKNGKELVLYGYKDSQGNIQYKAEEQ